MKPSGLGYPHSPYPLFQRRLQGEAASPNDPEGRAKRCRNLMFFFW